MFLSERGIIVWDSVIIVHGGGGLTWVLCARRFNFIVARFAIHAAKHRTVGLLSSVRVLLLLMVPTLIDIGVLLMVGDLAIKRRVVLVIIDHYCLVLGDEALAHVVLKFNGGLLLVGDFGIPALWGLIDVNSTYN